MVDAIVSFALQKLSDFLIQEAVFLHEVKDEVKWLKNELKWMRSFLKDAEEKQDSDKRIHAWVSEIGDIAYDTEDVIDTFILQPKEEVRRVSKRGITTSTNSIKKCFCISSKAAANLYDIGKEIKSLKKRVLDVSRKREVYGITSIGDAQQVTSGSNLILGHLRRTTSYADEEHVIGFEDDAQLLETKLLQGEQHRIVISILGMGGLGKTTLARQLYNNSNIKSKFSCHAWICVSQEWRTQDLLKRIIKSLKKLSKDEQEMLEKMDDDDSERYVRELLEGRRYLAVIDDVWQREAWESLRRAFPDNKNGSRIIITTRIEAVAELSVSDQRTYVHKLRFLRSDESWKLFCNKVLVDYTCQDNDGYCHCLSVSDTEKLGKEMVAKCDGLPLAIIVLGGLLARKQPHEWPVVKDHIWRELKNNSIHISSLLALSFKDLPQQLKPCFLYLGLYPEDSVINTEKLIRLWIAEGFILHGEEGQELEEVAEDYLKELIGRSLIQVVKRNWRMIATCRVHDLLRDLAINKARGLNFLHIFDEIKKAPSTMASSPYRRLAFHSGSGLYMSLGHSYPHVRILSYFNCDHKIYAEMAWTLKHTKIGLLRVLNLELVQQMHGVGELSDAIGELIHLRYLGLKDTGISGLPESIGKLQALQTLDASFDIKMRLPITMRKLKQLRHLKGRFSAPRFLLEELTTNLQILQVVHIGEEDVGFDLEFIAKLPNLEYLSLVSDLHMVSILPLVHCQHLYELRIKGIIGDLPEEIHKFLPNLKFLELYSSKLKQDPMPKLEMLPNLNVLWLSFIGVYALTCTSKGFPQLRVLQIKENIVVKMQVEEGGMPRLRALSTNDNDKIVFPERFKSLPAVKSLNLEWEDYLSFTE